METLGDEPAVVAQGRQVKNLAPVTMNPDFTVGPTAGVLRLRHPNRGWEPVHVTINQVEIDDGLYAGPVAMRLPTEGELADARLGPAHET